MAYGDPSPAEKEALVTSFNEIAAGEPSVATQFLEATSWNLEEAIQLFFLNGEVGGALEEPPLDATPISVQACAAPAVDDDVLIDPAEGDDVRAPLPVVRDTLYGDTGPIVLQPSQVVAFRDFEQESRQPAVWDSDQNAPLNAPSSSRENLASLYRPPLSLIYNGPFDKAKIEASAQGKWLLVNLQSMEEFSSHMLNRDTWANEAVEQTIRSNFIFWQVYHDSAEGRKVCTYYQLVSMPAILLIDPITGQKLRGWSGMIHPDRFLEDLLPYLDKTIADYHAAAQPQKRPKKTAQESAASKSATMDEDEEMARALAASMEESKVGGAQSDEDKDEPEKEAEAALNKKPDYPPLPEEPTGNRAQLCKVGIRLPDGRRLQRTFLRTDSVKLLWSFCSAQFEDGENRPFHFTYAAPVALKLEYGSNQTFEEAGLSNSMVTASWD